MLRKLQNEDADQIALLLNNKKIWDNLRDYVPFPYHKADAVTFIDSCQEENPQTTFAIEHEGKLVGIIALTLQQDVYRKSAEMGYWLGEPYWNQGIMTQAIKEIVSYAFNKLDLVRLYCGVFANNKASQSLLEKSGFQLEGVFRNGVFKNDQLMDEYRYALLNSN